MSAQVLGVRPRELRQDSQLTAKAGLQALAASCPGAEGAGMRVLSTYDETLPLFDDPDVLFMRYMPHNFTCQLI